jgi:hypothetical protein
VYYDASSSYTITSNTSTLYAFWGGLTISYINNNGSGDKIFKINIGQTQSHNILSLTSLSGTMNSGKTFVGWTNQSNGIPGTRDDYNDYEIGTTLTSDTTLYAIAVNTNSNKWRAQYDYNQPSGSDIASTYSSYVYQYQIITTPAPTTVRSNKTINSWSLSFTGSDGYSVASGVAAGGGWASLREPQTNNQTVTFTANWN